MVAIKSKVISPKVYYVILFNFLYPIEFKTEFICTKPIDLYNDLKSVGYNPIIKNSKVCIFSYKRWFFYFLSPDYLEVAKKYDACIIDEFND